MPTYKLTENKVSTEAICCLSYPCHPSHISHHSYKLGQSSFIHTLAISHIYDIIHTNWAIRYPSHSSSYIQSAIIWFHLYPSLSHFLPYQDKSSFTQISSFPLYIETGSVCMNILVKPISLLGTVLYTSPVVLFKPKYSYFSKSHIANLTYPKLGQSSLRIVHSPYLISTSNSHSHTYPLPTGSSMHQSSVSKRKVDNCTMLTLASNVPRLSKMEVSI